VELTRSERAEELLARTRSFMERTVIPAEPIYDRQRAELIARGEPHALPPIMEELQAEARALGLWNLFLPSVSGLTNVEYAAIAEETGRSPWIGPAAMNCLSPDTGNMELLDILATEEQRRTWLEPLLEGRIRSAFSMTEPDVASSDATNIGLRIDRDGDHYVLNGRKWFSTGAGDPRCELLIVLGRTAPPGEGERHRQHTMLLVPRHTPGVEVVRTLPVYGYLEQQGHAEIVYRDVRVPVGNVLGEEGGGFAAAQSRLGPGRVHHCMRAIGMAERALALACKRALTRRAFGGALADQGLLRAQIAEARIAIEQARLLVLKTAWMIDQVGAKEARLEIAAIKAAVPRMAADIVDRAVQIHGAAGVTDDTPLAAIWTRARTLRIVDGPDEVHLRTIARMELAKHRS
jgi:acyl-CoA dehydrogenase